MPLNSYAFALFLIAAAVVHHAVPWRARRHVVLAASLAFAASFGVVTLATLLAASVVAWVSGERIRRAAAHHRGGELACGVGVIALLGALALFKYAGALTGGTVSLVPPVGISYFTFKLVSYVVDVYWDRVPTAHGPLAVLRYAAFFPQLASGPIQRADDYVAQEDRPIAAEAPLVLAGLRLMAFGYFKKMVVADRAALLVDQVWARPVDHPPEVQALAVYLFAIQLYADFSGITDIARGAGRLFGIEGPLNFDNPYYAPNIQEFWRRWHMSLSSWLGDYLFKPLHMALRGWGKAGLVVAIVVNMLAIGVWHGPSMTFVVFGLINALYMVVSTLTLARRNKWFKKRPSLAPWRRVVGALTVFHLMALAFVPFRAPSLAEAGLVASSFVEGWPTMVASLARPAYLFRTLQGWSIVHAGIFVLGVIAMEIVHLSERRELGRRFEGWPVVVRWSAYYGMVVATVLFAMAETSAFIYFKF